MFKKLITPSEVVGEAARILFHGADWAVRSEAPREGVVIRVTTAPIPYSTQSLCGSMDLFSDWSIKPAIGLLMKELETARRDGSKVEFLKPVEPPTHPDIIGPPWDWLEWCDDPEHGWLMMWSGYDMVNNQMFLVFTVMYQVIPQ